MSMKPVVKAGLLAGTLDIVAACILYYFQTGKNPAVVLKFIASALFGKAAYTGGTSMVVLGLVMHFIIAFIFTILFFFIVQKVPALLKYKITTGIAYGIFIWLVMNLLVLPLTKAPDLPMHTAGVVRGMVVLIICIGLPLSFITAREYTPK